MFRVWVSSLVAQWLFTPASIILPSQLISTYTLIVSTHHSPPLRFCSCSQPYHWPDRLLSRHDWNSLLLSLLNKSLPILKNLVQNSDVCISTKPHSFHSLIHFSFTTSPHPIATVLAPNHGQNRPKDPPIYIQGHPQPWTWTPFF